MNQPPVALFRAAFSGERCSLTIGPKGTKAFTTLTETGTPETLDTLGRRTAGVDYAVSRLSPREARTLLTTSSNFSSACRNSSFDIRSFASDLSRLTDSIRVSIADFDLEVVFAITKSL